MLIINDLMVSEVLAAFVETEALPGTKLTAAEFWQGVSAMIRDFTPRVQEALSRRAELQLAIDGWHASSDALADGDAYERFLREISYLVEELRSSQSRPKAWTVRSPRSAARSSLFPCRTRASPSTRRTPAGPRCTTRPTAPTSSVTTVVVIAAASTLPYAVPK